MRRLTPLLLLALLAACEPDRTGINNNPNTKQAWVPVYALPAAAAVSVRGVRATTKAGKIYAFAGYIFQNELNEGIHIIDNTNPAQPKKVAFLEIPYNTELAVRGSYLYANRLNDLLVIDIDHPANPVVVKTIAGAFPLINQQYPPSTGYFVCPDPAKGIVVDWELKNVETANCRR